MKSIPLYLLNDARFMVTTSMEDEGRRANKHRSDLNTGKQDVLDNRSKVSVTRRKK